MADVVDLNTVSPRVRLQLTANLRLQRYFDENVARGAAFLDEKAPGWEKHIELEELELSSPSYCVLGQMGSRNLDAIFDQVKAKTGSDPRTRGFDGYGLALSAFTELQLGPTCGENDSDWISQHGFCLWGDENEMWFWDQLELGKLSEDDAWAMLTETWHRVIRAKRELAHV